MKRTKLLAVLGAGLLALPLAACGDDDDTETPDAEVTEEGEGTETTVAAEEGTETTVAAEEEMTETTMAAEEAETTTAAG